MKELMTAFVKAQQEFRHIPKSGMAKGTKFSYSYALLSDIRTATIPALLKHGLTPLQTVEINGRGVTVQTNLYHADSGEEWNRTPLELVARSESEQDIGSTISYARRYDMISMLNLAPDDDTDGHSQNGEVKVTQPQRPQPRVTSLDTVPEMPVEEPAPVNSMPDYGYSAKTNRFIHSLRTMHTESTKGMNKEAYGFMTGAVDGHSAKQHTAVYKVIFGEDINKDNMPGDKSAELSKWITGNNEAHQTAAINAIEEIAQSIEVEVSE